MVMAPQNLGGVQEQLQSTEFDPVGDVAGLVRILAVHEAVLELLTQEPDCLIHQAFHSEHAIH